MHTIFVETVAMSCGPLGKTKAEQIVSRPGF